MPSILILRHNFMTQKINHKLVSDFLHKHQINSNVIAPEEQAYTLFCKNPIAKLVKGLVAGNNDIKIIFFEANYGYPSEKELHETTKSVLSYLAQNCPDAVIILKSTTRDAIQCAEQHLKDKKFPENQIICEEDVATLTPAIKDLIRVRCRDFDNFPKA